MLGQGCTPDAITYGALICALDRGGQWRRALGAFAQMTSQVRARARAAAAAAAAGRAGGRV
jgi:pentatricopeptide repeat protein